jgi:hypothetical protein
MATMLAIEGMAFTSKDGMRRVITPGQTIDDGDPDFKGREHLFEPADERAARNTSSRNRGVAASGAGRAAETATAAPGERRTRTSPPPTAPPSK